MKFVLGLVVDAACFDLCCTSISLTYQMQRLESLKTIMRKGKWIRVNLYLWPLP